LYLPQRFCLPQLSEISAGSLDILLNQQILQINQDPLSIAVSPFNEIDGIATHWSGPLSTGATVLMIINPSNVTVDITLEWRDIPQFKNSDASLFSFQDVGGLKSWTGNSSIGFAYAGIPGHGSLVMIVEEVNGALQELQTAQGAYL
jgi:Alpha galactosidase C-terminal beta sandwich domain